MNYPTNRRELEAALHKIGYVLDGSGKRLPVEGNHIYTEYGAYRLSLYSYNELEVMYRRLTQDQAKEVVN